MSDDASQDEAVRRSRPENSGPGTGLLLAMYALIAAGLAVFTLFGLGPSGSPLLAIVVGVVAFAALAAFARPRSPRQ